VRNVILKASNFPSSHFRAKASSSHEWHQTITLEFKNARLLQVLYGKDEQLLETKREILHGLQKVQGIGAHYFNDSDVIQHSLLRAVIPFDQQNLILW